MSKCLITTLSESVLDDSLLKLGEFKFHVNESTVVYLSINSDAGETTVKVSSPGYVTDSTGTSNLGRTVECNTGHNIIYLSSGSYDVIVSAKTDIKYFVIRKQTASGSPLAPQIDLNDFDGCTLMTQIVIKTTNVSNEFDVIKLSNLYHPLLSNIYMIGSYDNDEIVGSIDVLAGKGIYNVNLNKQTQIHGDVASLANASLLTIDIGNAGNITGSIAAFVNSPSVKTVNIYNTNIDGNLSSISSLTSVETLNISNTSVVGALSSLSGFSQLKALYINNTAISGDTSDLAGLTNLTSFYYANCPNITGTWPLV